jgi:hypothetical protein
VLSPEIHVNKNICSDGKTDKPDIKMLEQMFLTPFVEIVKNNLDDIEYMRRIRYLFKKRYEFVDRIVRDNPPKKPNRLQELEEAMRRDRARRNQTTSAGNEQPSY